MTIDFAIKCLELMGYPYPLKTADDFGIDWNNVGPDVIRLPQNRDMTNEEHINFTIEQLAKREDVVDIAVSWLRDRQELQNVNGGNDCEFLLYAIELGIAPEELMGVGA
jgi:hypothetical protein